MQTPAYLLGSQPVGSIAAAAVVAAAAVLAAAEPAVAAAAAAMTQAKERVFCR